METFKGVGFFFLIFFMDHLFISGLLTGRVSLWESNTASETKVIREDESPSLFIKKKKKTKTEALFKQQLPFELILVLVFSDFCLYALFCTNGTLLNTRIFCGTLEGIKLHPQLPHNSRGCPLSPHCRLRSAAYCLGSLHYALRRQCSSTF